MYHKRRWLVMTLRMPATAAVSLAREPGRSRIVEGRRRAVVDRLLEGATVTGSIDRRNHKYKTDPLYFLFLQDLNVERTSKLPTVRNGRMADGLGRS